MGGQVRLAPALGAWITRQLDAGLAPAALVEVMQERMAPAVARAVVDAFMRARAVGAPPPMEGVELADAAAPVGGYLGDPPRLPAGGCIRTHDRVVRVAARAERPTLAVLCDVLGADECEELMVRARPRLAPSTVVDPATGRDTVAGIRSSWGMFFRPQEDPFIARLERRISEIMGLPVENGEGLQVLHYPEGAGSAPHFDYLVPGNAANRASIERSGQRVSTLVTYLNDVPAGGETVFPALGWAVSPQVGHAVLFEYCNREGEVDPTSLHASRAVLRGEKWVATKWMRARRFVTAAEASSARA